MGQWFARVLAAMVAGVGTIFRWLGSFFLSAVAATWVGTLVIAVGLAVTAYQIRVARQSIQATMLYNVEKDFGDLFTATEKEFFQACYGTGAGAHALEALPAICPDVKAKQAMFDLLVFYRMLDDLKGMNAISAQYVTDRIEASCRFFRTPRGKSTINEFRAKEQISAPLFDTLKNQCGVS